MERPGHAAWQLLQQRFNAGLMAMRGMVMTLLSVCAEYYFCTGFLFYARLRARALPLR